MSLGHFGGASSRLPFHAGGGGVEGSAGMGAVADFRFPHPPTEVGTFTDVTASRVVSTTYRNTSGRKRRVGLAVNSTVELGFTVQVDSVSPPVLQFGIIRIRVLPVTSTHSITLWFEVPDGWYYKLEVDASNTMSVWVEQDE